MPAIMINNDLFLMVGNWDYGITPQLKLGLRDFTPFEIWITYGTTAQDPPVKPLNPIPQSV